MIPWIEAICVGVGLSRNSIKKFAYIEERIPKLFKTIHPPSKHELSPILFRNEVLKVFIILT